MADDDADDVAEHEFRLSESWLLLLFLEEDLMMMSLPASSPMPPQRFLLDLLLTSTVEGLQCFNIVANIAMVVVIAMMIHAKIRVVWLQHLLIRVWVSHSFIRSSMLFMALQMGHLPA